MKLISICFFILLSKLALAESNFSLQIETGILWQNRNDFKITPQEGSLIKLDQIKKGPFFHHRLEMHYKFGRQHTLRAVYAPFFVSITKHPNSSLNFNKQIFSSSQPVNIDYQFNSYRLSYSYQLYQSPKSLFQLGLTAKIRDAKISVEQNNIESSYNNVGFVPLLFLAYHKKLNQNWYMTSDLDFAAAPQGRALDFVVKMRRKINQHYDLGLGLRTLEGGADNKKVFTFSWFNYFVFDIVGRF